MEPIAGLATVVGLLSDFVAEGRSRDADAWDEFRLELDSRRHKRILDELDSNEQLTITLKSLLMSNHGELQNALNGINNSLAKLLSTSGLGEIANAFLPEEILSDGALFILQEMESMQASSIEESSTVGRVGEKSFLVNGGHAGNLVISGENHRFLSDDLLILLELGLLRHDYANDGRNMYQMTRNASNLVKSISKS